MLGFVYLTFLKKKLKIQMELLLHNVIFNGLVCIFKKFEISPMNEKYPKTL
jgi:hypothetical protein